MSNSWESVMKNLDNERKSTVTSGKVFRVDRTDGNGR